LGFLQRIIAGYSYNYVMRSHMLTTIGVISSETLEHQSCKGRRLTTIGAISSETLEHQSCKGRRRVATE
jgi:hypothetical protein